MVTTNKRKGGKMVIVGFGDGEYELWKVNEVGEPLELIAVGEREWVVELAKEYERRGMRVDVMKEGK